MLIAPRRPEKRTIPFLSGICDTDECRCVISWASASRGITPKLRATRTPRRTATERRRARNRAARVSRRRNRR